jgi:xylulose-5-phosphate/fructose-6-phosphate phosphoketolase
MEVLSEHLCEGWLEGYLLTGRHGLFATYEAFAMVAASMTVQHAKWLEEAVRLAWCKPIASLNILLTSTCWRNDHNGFSHQGPGLIDTLLSKKVRSRESICRQMPIVCFLWQTIACAVAIM